MKRTFPVLHGQRWWYMVLVSNVMERITFYLVFILSIFLLFCVRPISYTRPISLPFISWSSDFKNDDKEKLLKAHYCLAGCARDKCHRTDPNTSLFRLKLDSNYFLSTLIFKPVRNLESLICMSLVCMGRLEYREGTHADTGIACKLQGQHCRHYTLCLQTGF